MNTADKELLAAIVEQLRVCGYECEAGPLESNLAFRQLERIASETAGVLTGAQTTKIINQVLNTEPYKTELNNSYYRKMVRQMLVETIALTQAALQSDEKGVTND